MCCRHIQEFRHVRSVWVHSAETPEPQELPHHPVRPRLAAPSKASPGLAESNRRKPASEHMKVLLQAGLVRARRIKQWTFYKRDEAGIRRIKRRILAGI